MTNRYLEKVAISLGGIKNGFRNLSGANLRDARNKANKLVQVRERLTAKASARTDRFTSALDDKTISQERLNTLDRLSDNAYDRLDKFSEGYRKYHGNVFTAEAATTRARLTAKELGIPAGIVALGAGAYAISKRKNKEDDEPVS